MHDRTQTLSLIRLLTLGALLALAGQNPSGAHAATAISQHSAGQMPPGFDQDVARVVANIDSIEADTLRKMDRPHSIVRDKSIHWGNCYSSTSIFPSIRTKRAAS